MKELDNTISSAVHYFRTFRDNMGIDAYNKISFLLPEFFDVISNDLKRLSEVISILEQCNSCLSNVDYIGLADTLEYRLKCTINNTLLKSESKEKILPYINEFSDSFTYGPITMHSRYDLNNESEVVFNEYFKSSYKTYLFIGFGHGYHIKKFLNENVHLKIVVLDKSTYEDAKRFADISIFERSKNVEITNLDDVDEDFFLRLDPYNNQIIFHTPSIMTMKDKKIQGLILENKIKYNSYLRFETDLRDNFEYNTRKSLKHLEDFVEVLKDRIVVIVAAGPSLQIDVDTLKAFRNDLFIFSVGAALKPLINNDLIPDAVVITDPSNIVLEQIESIKLNIPLLILDTANKGLIDNWYGDVILCPQSKYDETVNANFTVDSGGSVATSAVDIVIKAKANALVLSGMDFSYVNNLTHSKGSHRSHELGKNEYNYIEVENYEGDYNKTSRSLLIFKEWIEKRVKSTEIPVFNLTAHGARIENTKRITALEFGNLIVALKNK